MAKKKLKKQGRDLNVLLSITNLGQKMIEKVLPNKKKNNRPKHKYQYEHFID